MKDERRPARNAAATSNAADDTSADTERFPDGVHRARRVRDVAAHDGVHPAGLYLKVRSRMPRASWAPELIEAVRAAAAGLEEAA